MTDARASTVLILRHAHAEKGAPGQDDFDRQLDARGLREAEAASRWLLASGVRPDRILCSPAARTRGTLERLGHAVDGAAVEERSELYSGTVDTYLDAIRSIEAKTVLMVGHNPMIENLAVAVAGRGDRNGLASLAAGMKPATLAVIGFDTTLAEVAENAGRLLDLFVPER